MRRDLIIGILVSFVLHFGTAYISYRLKGGPPVAVKKADDDGVRLETHPLPPEEPEKIENPDEMQKPIEFAPPMRTDLPQLVKPESFVQPIQPPPPDRPNSALGVISVPTGNFNNQFGQLFDVSQLDQQPVATYQKKPLYPETMKRQGVAAWVEVQFIVDSTGKVQQVTVMNSSQREFEANALKAVQTWSFKAGKRGGKSVSTRMQVRIEFKISDE